MGVTCTPKCGLGDSRVIGRFELTPTPMNYGVFLRTLRHQDERFQAGSNTLTKATERTASGSKTAGCRCDTNHTGSEFDMCCILTRRKEGALQVPRDRGIFVILAVSRISLLMVYILRSLLFAFRYYSYTAQRALAGGLYTIFIVF